MKPLNEIVCSLLLENILKAEKEGIEIPLLEFHDDLSHEESSENEDPQ